MDSRPPKPTAPAQRPPTDTDPTPGTLVEPYRDRATHADPVLGPAQKPDEIGRLGPYRVLAELGRGGMGVVYRAEDPRLERQVALKVLLPDLAANPRARARFVREARAQAKVEHDHIIPIHSVEDANDVTFIVMPLLKGQTLAAALKLDPRPPLSEVVRIGREVAEGLAAAHAAGLIHRDIKPSNIWLEGNRRRVKILDFGLARTDTASPARPGGPQLPSTAAHIVEPRTATGAIMGTPAYMSPEQARSQPTDHRCDLFSLGAVLYQMATGRMPFTGPSTFDVVAAVVAHVPPAVHEVAPDVPTPLSELIWRLMSKNPAERPPSAEAVASELAAIERGLALLPEVVPLAPAPGAPNPWADIVTPESDQIDEDATAAMEPDEPPRGGAPKWLWPAAAVGLVAVGGLVWLAVAALNRPKAQSDVAKDESPATRPVKAEPKAPPAKSADRQAAEVLLRENAQLTIRLASGQFVSVPTEDQLPKGDFEITIITLPGDRPRPDFVAGAKPLLGRLKSLTGIIDLGQTGEWSEADILWLAGAPFAPVLLELRISFQLTQKSAGALAKLPALQRLYCGAGSADNATLEALAGARKLEALSLSAAGASKKVTAVGWVELTRLPLTTLLLDSPNAIDPRTCELFAEMPRLEHLRLTGVKLGEPELLALSKSRTLNKLELARDIPDAALAHLAQMPQLRDLDLTGNPITDAGLDRLHGAAGLRRLHVRNTPVTEEGVARLAKALPECKIYWGEGKIVDPTKTAAVPEKPTGGLEFDGKATNVKIPDFRFDGKVPLTVEAWVTPAATRSAHFILLSDGGGIGTSTDNAFGAGFFDGANWQNGYCRDKLKVGETTHVAAVMKTDRIEFYVNGKHSGTKTGLSLGALPRSRSPARIGMGFKSDGTQPFLGTMHGIRVSRGIRYDKDFAPAPRWDADDDTVLLYAFDEGTGAKLTDRSKSGWDGIVENGTWVVPKK